MLAAREGAAVSCADVDRAAAEETARLVEADGGKAHVLVGDVADEAVCRGLVEGTVAGLGGLDGVVLNVGIAAGRRLEGRLFVECQTDAEAVALEEQALHRYSDAAPDDRITL